jgi:superfamily II DNA or RNA helicase
MAGRVCTVTVNDEVFAWIGGLTKGEHQFLYKHMGVMVDGAVFTPLYKLGKWDGRVHFYTDDGRIHLRLLDQVLSFLEGWGYEIDLRDNRRPVDQLAGAIGSDWFTSRVEGCTVELRPYQVDALARAVAAGSGVVLSCTGSGKTWMCAALAQLLLDNGRRTVVIVPSADLVEQTLATFRAGGVDCGAYSGDRKELDRPVVVATWQALQNNPTVVEAFGAVIVDECHGAKAEVVDRLLTEHAKHIPYRWGFTGTLPKPKSDATTIRGTLGDVLVEIKASELIRLGYLAEIEIQPIEIQEPVEEDFPDYSAEKSYLARSPHRLELIADLAVAKSQEHGNTLVLVNSLKMGAALQALIPDSVFLRGATDNDVRAEWYSAFADRDNMVVIATYGIASTGISIDRVFCLVMVDAGKSFVRAIQTIGRSLRRAGDKTKAWAYDVYSNLKISKKHARDRAKYYKEASYATHKPVKMKP